MLQNKRVAVGLFGIHYVETLQHWAGWKPTVDYRKVYKNNHDVLYNNFDAHFFASTYFSPILNNLLQDFNFQALKLRHINNIQPTKVEQAFVTRNRIFMETIDLIYNFPETYDYVLLTRFDLHYKEMILSVRPFDLNKINFMCLTKWGSNEQLIDDNFYLLPYNKLGDFYKTLQSIPLNICSHEYCNYLKHEDIHCLVDGRYFSHEIPTYFISRHY